LERGGTNNPKTKEKMSARMKETAKARSRIQPPGSRRHVVEVENYELQGTKAACLLSTVIIYSPTFWTSADVWVSLQQLIITACVGIAFLAREEKGKGFGFDIKSTLLRSIFIMQ